MPQIMDRLGNQTKEQEIEHLLDSVRDYKFGELKPIFQLNPRIPLYSDQFELSQANHCKIQEIDSVLKNNNVAMLVGDMRTGVSSVGRGWVHQDEAGRRNIDLLGFPNGINEEQLTRYAEPQIFLDELIGDGQGLVTVEKFISNGRKLVIRPQLVGVEFYRNKLEKAGISFGEVVIKPITDDDMRTYLSRRFLIDINDTFISFITELSSGSLFVANYICGEFLDYDYGDSPKLDKRQILEILKHSDDQIRINFVQSKKRGETLPDDLKAILPDPKLIYLFSDY